MASIEKLKEKFQLKKKKQTKTLPDVEVEKDDHLEIKKKLIEFVPLLMEMQEFMSRRYAETLYDADKKEIVKQYIKQFMIDRNYYVKNRTLADVVNEVYVEMAEYALLTPYLKRTDLEEININAWNDIQVIPSRGKAYKLEQHFRSPEHAIDVIRRLLHNNKLVFDASKPITTGYLGDNIRITATHTVVVGQAAGVSASIRFVNPSKITRTQFVDSGTLTEEMFSFLADTFNYGLSAVYSGATGSGKTTLMAEVMATYPDSKRLITIEKSVREFNLIRCDENGRAVNNVIHLCTRDSDDENRNISILKLVTASLTMHPNAICVAEMKNEEAWEAQEASRTGHTVLTTTHADQAEQTYSRLATLCMQKYAHVPFDVLIQLVAEAFPLAVQLKQLEDGSRRVMEIGECILTSERKMCFSSLWKYEVDTDEIDSQGSRKIRGHFTKVKDLSTELQKKLLQNGMPRTLLNRYIDRR